MDSPRPDSARTAAVERWEQAVREQEASLDQREAAMERREVTAATRESVADQRERGADNREAEANERERIADDRDVAADVRERAADDRGTRLSELEQRLDARARVARLTLPSLHQRAMEAVEQSQALLALSAVSLDRSEADLHRYGRRDGREQPQIEREIAATERELDHRTADGTGPPLTG